jgi:FkbM family methyltransferase
MSKLRSFVARLPLRYQQELKRLHFARMIRRGLFTKAIENEGEFARLHQWIRPGDWVLDLGANVGNYAARLSELVQANGRVVAFEPVPQTFELLTANAARLPLRNMTLLNVAASDRFALHGMRVPVIEGGVQNPYMAHLTDENPEMSVMCLPVDSLDIQHPVSLVKIDVEGHELAALKGMRRLLERDHPVLIIEGRSPDVSAYLDSFGYSFEQDKGSPNRVFQHARSLVS